jgi:predicted AlkP superfamily phosphohydrolase/phosphomutase
VSQPVVLIGLDGATADVIDPLIAAGDLPTLARLAAGGTRAVLGSVVPPITPAAWSTFMTGKHPGVHGVYDFRVYDPRRYEDAFVTSRALRERTLWELLTAAGRRVGVVGLPMMYPPRARSGTIVSGFDTPSSAAEFTAPPELRQRLLARFPDYLFVAAPDPADPNLTGEDAFTAFLAAVERSLAQRTQVALDLLAEGRWDVFMVHYQDTDVVQHAVWRFIEQRDQHPARWDRLRAIYRRVDAHLAEVLAAAPADALVLVLSDHGFGSHTGRLFPNVLLQRWGYLAWRGRRRERWKRSLRKGLGGFGLGRRPPVPEEAWAVRVREQSFAHALPLRWRRTKAYVALAEIYGLLYVNLRGREPEGIVAPGAERDALVEALRTQLLNVRDPRDGEPVFAAVVPGETLYPGGADAARPDLVLVPRPGYSVHRTLHPRLWIDHHGVMAGTHRPEGILLANGPGVRHATAGTMIGLADLAPTVLAVSGVAVPEDMTGRVLSELFTEPPTVTYAPPSEAAPSDPGGSSEGDDAQVMQRLRALGYMT